MKVEKDLAIKGFQMRIEALANIKSLQDFEQWVQTTLSFTDRIYGGKSTQHKQVEQLSKQLFMATDQSVPDFISDAKSLLDGYISEIDLFGTP